MAGSGQQAGSATQPSVNAWLLRSLELCCTGSGITNPRIPNSRVIQEPQSSSDPRSQSTSDVLDTRGFGYTFQGLLFEIPSYRRQHFPLPLEQSIRRTLCGPPPLVSVHPGQASRVSFPPPPESNPLPRHGSFTPSFHLHSVVFPWSCPLDPVHMTCSCVSPDTALKTQFLICKLLQEHPFPSEHSACFVSTHRLL